MQEIFQNDTWQIDVAESDKDPDFIPQTKESTMKMTRNILCQATEGENQSNQNVFNSKETFVSLYSRRQQEEENALRKKHGES